MIHVGTLTKRTNADRRIWTRGPRDVTMQVESDHGKEVCNGDLGIVACIDLDAGELVATIDEHEVAYGFGEPNTLALVCATAMHYGLNPTRLLHLRSEVDSIAVRGGADG